MGIIQFKPNELPASVESLTQKASDEEFKVSAAEKCWKIPYHIERIEFDTHRSFWPFFRYYKLYGTCHVSLICTGEVWNIPERTL